MDRRGRRLLACWPISGTHRPSCHLFLSELSFFLFHRRRRSIPFLSLSLLPNSFFPRPQFGCWSGRRAMLCYAAERRRERRGRQAEGADMIHRGRILAGSSSLPPSVRWVDDGYQYLLPCLQPPAIVTTGEQDWTGEGGRTERAGGGEREKRD